VRTAPLFDAYVMVDWSAAGQPARGKDSIWICYGRSDGVLAVENVATRHQARERLRTFFAAERAGGRAVLAGFDFAFGYPSGFAERLALAGEPWRATWDLLAAEIHDAPDNKNNRFEVASHFNQLISGGNGPFWGCPASEIWPYLRPHHHRRHEALGLPERRIADAWINGPQPVWKLAYAGAVGSQSLTGIPVLRWLRHHADFATETTVWPFETGLRTLSRADTEGRIVLAEIYPSLVKVHPQADETRDECQVRAMVEHFTNLDAAGALGAHFAGDPALDAAQRRAIEREESWILGVVTKALRAPAAPLASPDAYLSPSPPRSGGEGRVRGSLRVRDIDHRVRGVTPHTLSSPRASAGGEGTIKDAVKKRLSYLRDPEAIYAASERHIEQSVDLSRFPQDLRPLARRVVHATAEPSIADDLVWSENAFAAGRAALEAGAAVLVDAEMVAAGIIARNLPAKNDVRCTLSDRRVPGIARRLSTTRSAAAVELWRPLLEGSVVAIGNAPTALFHLLEMIAAGAPRPALVLGFPVGFVGAAEAKAALAANRLGLAFIALGGRRGGSALAAAAVNALARAELAA
jgi:precorrin-8X/cobalt-precorrin-8 methylmutase